MSDYVQVDTSDFGKNSVPIVMKHYSIEFERTGVEFMTDFKIRPRKYARHRSALKYVNLILKPYDLDYH